jgi:hypothetical protein
MTNILPTYNSNGNLGTVKLPNGTNTIVTADPILLGPATCKSNN